MNKHNRLLPVLNDVFGSEDNTPIGETKAEEELLGQINDRVK